MTKRLSHKRRSGIILLVVLSSLAFFSILVASYVVFSRESHQSAFVRASRHYRAPDVHDLLDEAFLTLVRGTDDPNSPMYGEDLLTDYYGRTDWLSLEVAPSGVPQGEPRHIGGGYVRFGMRSRGGGRPVSDSWDDMYTGRLVTFLGGPLKNQTFRVLRSRVHPAGQNLPPLDLLYISLHPGLVSNLTNAVQVRNLFYVGTNTSDSGFNIHMNGPPRNSPGIGFDGTNVNETIGAFLPMDNNNPPKPIGFPTLPVGLQPNQIPGIETINKSTFAGDFDENYDAADFNNWLLSHRNADGSIIPSFHRPSVINYILNQESDWENADPQTYRNAIASIARATMRPLPIAAGQFGGNAAINPQFTGGSTHYALRTPLFLRSGTQAQQRLNQLAKALIADPADRRNQWDVDNSKDGIKDSIWMDIGLPRFTSPEGKLLKPLIAPRIEDLTARLNVNAHSNSTLALDVAGLNSEFANWAGTQNKFGTAANRRQVFRGLGYGPAEIGIPAVSGDTSNDLTPAMRNSLRSIVSDRYQSRYGANVPGRPGADPLDILRTGYRPNIFTAGGGYGRSIDPFGRGGVAIGRSGDLVAAVSGTRVQNGSNPPADRIDEAINDPYESDPSGNLSGDTAFSFAELEPLLRSNEFDVELLPERLRSRLTVLLEQHPEFARLFTTHSKSDDTPLFVDGSGESAYTRLTKAINTLGGGSVTPQQMSRLVAPELRLGRKIDINRPFGNGVDDTPQGRQGFGIIDEPREILPGVLLPNQPGAPLEPNTSFTVTPGGFESEAFEVNTGSGQTVPNRFQDIEPRYNFSLADDFDATVPDSIYEYDADGNSTRRQLTSRQLMARHLYVLMMFLTKDYEFPSMAETFDPQRDVSGVDEDLFKARRIAQWAVNVADYRDPDSIMTRFVFDQNPFNGWSAPEEPAPERFVVWGVESPELTFSESLAIHDVRVSDTDRDPTGKRKNDEDDGVQDTDSIRMPQGSLFLELYCPRPQVTVANEQSTKPGVPRELYRVDTNTGEAELNLGRSAPPRPGATSGAPVWRIAISERHDLGQPKEGFNPQRMREEVLPDSYSFDPQHPDQLGGAPGAANRLNYDRYVWFRSFDDANEINELIIQNGIRGNGTNLMQAYEVFFAPTTDRRTGNDLNAVRRLQPGQFLALAPRATTHLGSREFNAGVSPGVPSSQRFQTSTGEGVVQADRADERLTPLLGPRQHYTSAVPMIIGAFTPEAFSNAWADLQGSRVVDTFQHGFIGLNVSEPRPNSYYPQPSHRYNGNEDQDDAGGIDYPLYDAYLDYTESNKTARDFPIDIDPIFNFNRIAPIADEPTLGTVPEYCTAFLQRLADPTIPYDPRFNPYQTLDWISIDLTVFSGEERPDTVNQGAGNDPAYGTRSRQRNGSVHRDSPGENTLFSYETNSEDFEPNKFVSVSATAPDFFTLTSPGNYLYSSLSFLNTATSGATVRDGRSNPTFNGYAPSLGSQDLVDPNDPDAEPRIVGNDRNLPSVPYARHPWLNRPFASHFELMMVPASSSGRLFEEFSINLTGTDPEIFPNDSDDPHAFYSPFRHLLNFFHSAEDPGSGNADGANFARLFEFVHTLPRFKGEVEMILPAALDPGDEPPGDTINDPAFRSLLRPPFNFHYDNQRLAQVNLNTLSEFQTWAGLMQGHLTLLEFTAGTNQDQLSYFRFLESRRGYSVNPTAQPETILTAGDVNYDPGNLDHRFPTSFAGVYKDGTTARFAPDLRDPDATNLLRRSETNASLLRGRGVLDVIEPPGAVPQLVPQFVRGQDNPSHDPYRNRDRNAFTRYQTLMRMPNLSADNSQIYLIQLTMGFFEVDATNGNLGREYNEDMGQNKRYRAMYIIDRSKEVGFIPGQDLNVRDIVLFERYAQ